MDWTYRGYKVTELSPEIRGFVYIIYFTNGQKYIGSKVVRSDRRIKPLKSMRSNAVRRVTRESKWREYEGSSKLTEGLTIKTKVITHLCTDKRSMTYLEQKELFAVDAAVNDEFVNKNIGGKFFSNCLDGLWSGTPKESCLFGGEYH